MTPYESMFTQQQAMLDGGKVATHVPMTQGTQGHVEPQGSPQALAAAKVASATAAGLSAEAAAEIGDRAAALAMAMNSIAGVSDGGTPNTMTQSKVPTPPLQGRITGEAEAQSNPNPLAPTSQQARDHANAQAICPEHLQDALLDYVVCGPSHDVATHV